MVSMLTSPPCLQLLLKTRELLVIQLSMVSGEGLPLLLLPVAMEGTEESKVTHRTHPLDNYKYMQITSPSPFE